jgi:hypothetical protein
MVESERGRDLAQLPPAATPRDYAALNRMIRRQRGARRSAAATATVVLACTNTVRE